MGIHNKKGFALAEVPSLAIVLVVVAIVLGIGSTILTQTRANQCAGTFQGVTYYAANNTCYKVLDAENATQMGPNQWNVSTQGLSGLNTLASWQPTWAVIIAAAIVIGIIAAYLMFGKKD
jgi:hypothetical protein